MVMVVIEGYRLREQMQVEWKAQVVQGSCKVEWKNKFYRRGHRERERERGNARGERKTERERKRGKVFQSVQPVK